MALLKKNYRYSCWTGPVRCLHLKVGSDFRSEPEVVCGPVLLVRLVPDPQTLPVTLETGSVCSASCGLLM